MQVQTALNYFGFPAGTVDGVMGGNSRAAIGQYQATLGYPATGVLSEYERAFLTTSYDRAMVGGPQAAQIMASGQGTRGLLLAYRQEQAGVPAPMPQPAAPPVIAAPPAACAGRRGGGRAGACRARAASRRREPRRPRRGCRASCPARRRCRWTATATASAWRPDRTAGS